MAVLIYMLGGAGYHNFGDELMVRCWLDFFRRFRPGEAVVVDGASKAALHQAFDADYPDFSYTDACSLIADRTESRKFWPSFIRGLTFFERGGFNAHKGEKADGEQMLQADVLHLHGGGYLNIHFPRKAFLMGVAVAVSRMTGSKLIGTGLGVLPLSQPTDEQLAKIEGALEQFTFLETRDREGAAFLQALAPKARIISGVDDTFLGPLQYQHLPGRRLHLSWNEGEMDTPAYRRAEAYALDHHADYDEVIFWNCARNDAGTWRRLVTVIPGLRELKFHDLLLSPIPVSPGDHMLTARFHPHLIAARGGAVGGFYSPGEYYDVKHGSICAIGSGFFPIKDKPIDQRQFGRCDNTLMASTPELRAAKLGRAVLFYCETAARTAAKTA